MPMSERRCGESQTIAGRQISYSDMVHSVAPDSASVRLAGAAGGGEGCLTHKHTREHAHTPLQSMFRAIFIHQDGCCGVRLPYLNILKLKRILKFKLILRQHVCIFFCYFSRKVPLTLETMDVLFELDT